MHFFSVLEVEPLFLFFRDSPKKPKLPSNSRKEMALSAHKVDSAIPVRRNRPKNWKMLRPDKPRPPKLKQLVEEKKK